MTRRERRYNIYSKKYRRHTREDFNCLPIQENQDILYKWIRKLYTKGVSLERANKLYRQAVYLHQHNIITTRLDLMLEDDISEIMLKLQDRGTEANLSEATVHDYKRWFKQFYNYYEVYDERLNSNDSAKEVKLLYQFLKDIKNSRQMKQKDRSSILDINDLQLMLSNCQSNRNKAIIALLYYTGWRIEAIATIRMKDIDFKKKCWTICVNDKTGEARLPIYEPIPLLRKYLESHPQTPDSWLFLNKGSGKPVTYSRYVNILQEVKRKIQESNPDWNKKVNPHWFRHSWATRNVNRYSQRDFTKLGKWCANSRAIAHYDHLNDEDLYASFAEENGVEEVQGNLDKSWLCTECSKLNTSLYKICSCGVHRFYSQKDKNKQQEDIQKELRLQFLDKVLASPELDAMWQKFRANM